MYRPKSIVKELIARYGKPDELVTLDCGERLGEQVCLVYYNISQQYKRPRRVKRKEKQELLQESKPMVK